MCLRVDQSLLDQSHNFSATFTLAYLVPGKIVGWMFCGWLDVPVPPLKVLLAYEKLLVQILYLPLLGFTVGVTFIESMEFLL